MPDYDENYVSGCHGTVAEQLDEAYYDDRSDADDDMQKGRIKFPKDKLYGREKELGVLRQLYDAMETNNLDETGDDAAAAEGGGQHISFEMSPPSHVDSRVVFLSGYSGVGKSALVAEFINQIQREHNNSTAIDTFSPVLHFSGKYIQQSGGAAPFSAISEVFGNIVSSLFNAQKENDSTRSLCTKIWKRIQSSDVIGPDTDGNEVLIKIFPSLRPLLDGSAADIRNKLQRADSLTHLEGGGKDGEPSMNAVKESTRELLAQITSSLKRPLILFLDDLQWADGPSLELLSFLMDKDAQLKNLMLICAYRSNEVGGDHPFAGMMTKVTESRGQLLARIDLFSLSQDAIYQFIADSIAMEEQDRVAELVEVIYPKTMGNIFCVMQALEELVRKNALYYDMMYFEWRWTVDKIKLDNLVSADVVETIKDKIKGLSADIQKLLAVMAHIPCSVEVPVLKELLGNSKGNDLNEDKIASLLKEASENGMLMWSTESGNYVFTHDRIREASRGFVVEQERDELLLHIANVLLRLGKGSKMEWCLYTAVDLLNSLSPEQVDIADLIKLNLRVSKMAKSRGSPEKENMLLRESMERLKPSKWKDYNLSLGVYNAVMESEFNLGNYDRMSAAIDEVLDHSIFLRDKFSAYLHKVKHLSDNLNDYTAGAHEGVKVLNMFSYNIPLQPTKTDMIREKMKLKLALKGRSFASLINLQVIEDPIFELFAQVCRDSLFSGQRRLVMVVAWIAVRRAIQIGFDGYFLHALVILGQLQGKKGNVMAANEIGNVALALSENFRDIKFEYSFIQFANQAGILFHLQSFRSGVDILHQCYKDLRFLGRFDYALGSQLNGIYAYLAAGLPLGTIFESKLIVLDEFCQSNGKTGFAASFEIHRQFAMNLRKRSDHPTLLNGPAFEQDTALAAMNDQARKMTLRDASIFRLELAFIFNDTKCMAEMLQILSGYPFEDQVIPRFYIRACFLGLAAFSLSEKKYHAIGNKCLKYFRRMKKLGSTNAPPAYYFIAALKKPTKKAFTAAIDSCREANMQHLEAMVRERYAMFLMTQKESDLSRSFIASAYW
eukprot:CAMPEP_0201696292 /NCGR_PEP_ID=MMETSP0578-20130828/8002_1 /ASSEMBLY_ACC=CAM_ASM_000663 /TAXON_ID=267565 /ORGANISM="Skeletonema grethea, Strain CCMP 1804" /LENGTH=1063 /DNA_ID=CAMNT_0048182267 /DNA_START=34 /DNA_END=3222 /DNA_ORIENTATION=+